LNTDGAITSLTELAGYEPASVREAAHLYTNLKLHFTPLDGKKPRIQNWLNRVLSEDEIEAHFGASRNIGIVLGGTSGLVDVDLDHPLAVEVAEHLLPETLTCGRESRPHSHRLYLCESMPSNRSYALTQAMASDLDLDSERSTLVELRGEGRQMVAAPSIHPVDGDRYVWDGGEIQCLEGSKLEDLVNEVAIATLLGLHWR
jgi:hypothetical protein